MLTGLLMAAALNFDAGADLRIRQEMMDNVPGLPGVGLLAPVPRGDYRNHMRFRTRVWGQTTLTDEDLGVFSLYARLTDECRWNSRPKNHVTTFPDELILDNLYLDGKGLFDELLDFRVGRQDIYGLFGLDHVFVDGTPGDGSRTVYADMARVTLHVTEESKLDVFALYDFDESDVRWGTRRSRHRSLSGLGGGAEPDMDDWGYGVVWSSRLTPGLQYQLFAVQKNTASYVRRDAKHPRTRRETFGAKVEPQLTENVSLQFEGMAQVGENGRDEKLAGWSAYAGANWRGDQVARIGKPFGKVGLHMMSGDEDAAREDGGHSAWDPLWARGVNDSELFLYGTHYGAAWWSNMIYLKSTLGFIITEHCQLVGATGPMFAEAKDGLGGGEGAFKGLLSQLRLDFPLWLPEESRFEAFGHLLAEFFNPGDYFATDKPSWFVRWQVDFRF